MRGGGGPRKNRPTEHRLTPGYGNFTKSFTENTKKKLIFDFVLRDALQFFFVWCRPPSFMAKAALPVAVPVPTELGSPGRRRQFRWG